MSRYGQTGGKDIATDARRLRPLLAALGGVDTYKAKVSADDTTPDYLEQKFSSIDTSVEITVKNAGANEVVDFSVATYVADEIATHTSDPDAHHSQVHVLATTAGLGADHTVSGLTAGQVLRATGAATAAFAALQATDLPAHVLATNLALGSQHTISGATMGHVLRATGATTAAIAQLQHSDLGSVGANDHHSQSHVLASTSGLGADHTVSGLTAGQVLRATGAATAAFASIQATDLPTGATLSVSSTNSGNSHAITSSSAVSTATAVLLATDSNGRSRVQGLGVGAAAADNYVIVPTAGGIGLATSSAARIVFTDDTTDQIEMLSADVLIGGSAKDSNIATSVEPRFNVIDGDAVISQDGIDAVWAAYAYSSSSQAAVHLRTARGSRSTPTATQSDDNIGRLGAGGYTGSAFLPASNALIQFVASENWSGSANGARVEIHGTANGDTSPTEIARFSATSSEAKLTISASGDEMVRLDNSSATGNPYVSFYQSGTRRSFIQHADSNDSLILASEYGRIELKTDTAGTEVTRVTVYADGGTTFGFPTGASKGNGTINVSGDVYKNNSAYTNPDYALEAWRDGRITHHAHNPGAKNYRRLTLEEVEDHIRESLRLPGFTDKPAGMFARGDLLLEKIEELYTHLIDINKKVEALHG